MIKALLRYVALGLLVLSLLGCGPCNYAAEKMFLLFGPTPKTRPAFSLEGKSILILVDVGNQDLADDYPLLTYQVAKIVAAELSDRRAAASIVSPRDLVTYAQREPDYRRKSAVEIGEAFNVQQVLHVVVQSYALEAAAGGDSYNGMTDVGLRVIDVAAKQQVFPDMETLHFLEVKSPMGITADSQEAAERILLDGLALKVGQVFVAYDLDSLPKKPQVK